MWLQGDIWRRGEAPRQDPSGYRRMAKHRLGGAGLAGASFEMEWSTSRLGVGGKSTTDYGKNSGGVVVKVGVFLWAESSFQRRASSAVAA